MTITENFLHASYSHESFLDLMTFFGAVGCLLCGLRVKHIVFIMTSPLTKTPQKFRVVTSEVTKHHQACLCQLYA